MEVQAFFLHLFTVLLTVRIFAELTSRFHVPPVMGKLFVGVLLGPSLPGWVEPTEMFTLLARVGGILLMFEVGLETDVLRLIHVGPKAAIVALAGFFLPS